jgi:hypothetical protein
MVLKAWVIILLILCSVDRASQYNSCKWPTWRTILFSICLYKFSACFEQPRAHHQEKSTVSIQQLVQYVSLCVGDRLVCRSWRTRRSSIQRDTYQMYWYNWFTWWWARVCSKHVENWNKHTEKRNVRQVGYLQESSKYSCPSLATCPNLRNGTLMSILKWHNARGSF